jgi:cellulose synthase/poly-beta-1,6-N-acetylglucosamine synthase-like glycosyltransferase
MTTVGEKTYLKEFRIGSARDLEGRERIIYRLLEMFPGTFVWLTFAVMVLGAFFVPALAAIFIIVFDTYWLLKTVYFSFHLRASFRLMREYSMENWMRRLETLECSHSPSGIRDWRDIRHLVVIPFYREGVEILRHTLEALKKSSYPKKNLFIIVSGEERRGDAAEEIGRTLKCEFGDVFGKFLFTIHRDEPGEIAGKGANETAACKKAIARLIDPASIDKKRILVSVFDADTVVPPQYFARLTYSFLVSPHPYRCSFQPVPLFTNNIWEAPALARVIAFSSTFWHLINQVRPERLTSFSSQSFSLKALLDVGFWQTNVVSEDSRIFWQGMLAFDGDWRVEPLHIAVSMDANMAENFWKTMKNLYLQQRRWAYGAENIPYFLYGFWKNRRIARGAKCYWTFHIIEGFWSWATNSIMIFMLGWLPLFLGGDEFGTTVLAYNTPRFTRYILTLAMVGIVSSIYLSIVLLPPRPPSYGRHQYFFMALQWLIIPFTLIVFGSLPAIDAQTRLMLGRYLHFWPTPKVRKNIQGKA